MAETRTASATSDAPADPGRPIRAAFEAAIRRATSDLKGLATLLGALAGVAVAYLDLLGTNVTDSEHESFVDYRAQRGLPAVEVAWTHSP